jgi:hypothetical protein
LQLRPPAGSPNNRRARFRRLGNGRSGMPERSGHASLPFVR